MTQWIGAITRGHNGGAVLLKDGEIVFAIEEERLTRKKYDGGPLAAMIKFLDYTDHCHSLVQSFYNHLLQLLVFFFSGIIDLKSHLRRRNSAKYLHPLRNYLQLIFLLYLSYM